MLTYLRFAQNAASRIVGICLGLTLTVCAVPLLAQTPAQPPAQTQPAAAASTSTPRSFGDIVAAAPADAWRTPDPQNVVYLDIPTGRVVIELAPNLAPEHVANIRTLIREKYFDDLAIVRSQDNYVVQWGHLATMYWSANKMLTPQKCSAILNAFLHSLGRTRHSSSRDYTPQQRAT